MAAKVGLIDVDGVLANFNNAFLDLLNERHVHKNWRRFQSAEGPTTWDWPQAVGFPQEDIDLAWGRVARNPAFWANLESYPGTIDFLRRLKHATQERLIQPYFVTNRIPPSAADFTNRWLNWHGYADANVIAVNKSGTKHLIAEAVGADFIIDDYWKNFDGMPANVRKYLVDKPWNRLYEVPEDVTRVFGGYTALSIELERP
jgi:hypothetical protein